MFTFASPLPPCRPPGSLFCCATDAAILRATRAWRGQAVVFLFRFGQDGGSMVVTMADAERVLDTASKTRLCRRDPELLLEVFMEHCGAGEPRTRGWERGCLCSGRQGFEGWPSRQS